MNQSQRTTRLCSCLLLLLLSSSFTFAKEWELLWNDEFNDEADTINANYWTPEVGFLGFNGEFQTYTDQPQNVRVEDGKLHLSAVRDLTAQVGYTSGRINTMNKIQMKYGMVEASIKIPDMKLGLWPAFWTLGSSYPEVGWPKAGEMDILEGGQKLGSSQGLGNNRVVTAFHWDAIGNYVVEDAHIDMPYDLSVGFHTYKMVWQPDFIETSVDGRLMYRFRIDYCSTLWDCEQEFHDFHFLILNLAVAGLFTCCEYGFELNDYPNGTAWDMEVDYVRLYGNEHTEVKLPDLTTPAPVSATPETAAPTTKIPTLQPSAEVPGATPPTVPPTVAQNTSGAVSSMSQAPMITNVTAPPIATPDPTATVPTPAPSLRALAGGPTITPSEANFDEVSGSGSGVPSEATTADLPTTVQPTSEATTKTPSTIIPTNAPSRVNDPTQKPSLRPTAALPSTSVPSTDLEEIVSTQDNSELLDDLLLEDNATLGPSSSVTGIATDDGSDGTTFTPTASPKGATKDPVATGSPTGSPLSATSAPVSTTAYPTASLFFADTEVVAVNRQEADSKEPQEEVEEEPEEKRQQEAQGVISSSDRVYTNVWSLFLVTGLLASCLA